MSDAETYQREINRVASAGLADASRVVAGVRADLRRALQHGVAPRAGMVRERLLHGLVPSLARTMAVAHATGVARSRKDSEAHGSGVSLAWDESEHPRDPGGERGGQFVSKAESEVDRALREKPLYEMPFIPWKDAVDVEALGLDNSLDGEGLVDNMSKESERAIQDASETREFSVKDLHATQHVVRAGQVKEALRRDRSRDDRHGLPVVAKFEDNLFVLDGTHRVVADGLLGRKTRATYVDLDAVTGELSLDWFSEVTRELRDAGLGPELTRAQRGYARRVYDSMRHMGAGVDARTRALVANLIADKTPLPKAMKVLDVALDKLGIGPHSRGKLETIYRTESSAAYYAGRWQHDQKDPKVWGYRYLQIERPTKRDEHVPLNGTTLPKNALFWRRYWPPNGWNCGCHIQTLYGKAKEVLPGKIDGEVPKPDKGFRKNFGKDLGAVEFSHHDGALSLGWDESLHPRDPAGTAEGGQFTSKMPTSLSQLKHVKALGGTTGAQLYEDADGNRYVVKSGASPGHAANEVLANKLYRLFGVLAPRTELIDGKLVARFVKGKPLNELTKAEQELAEKKLAEHFAVDALLGNWDVVGLNKDNVIVDDKGRPWRVDNGGALSYRAKGAKKGDKWNAEVSELKTMREKDVAGQVFGKHLTDQKVKDQVDQVMSKVINAGALDKVSDQLDATFHERVKTLDAMSYGKKFWPWQEKEKAAHAAMFPGLMGNPATPKPSPAPAQPAASSGKTIPYKEKEAWLKEQLQGDSWTGHQVTQAAIMNHDPSAKKVYVSWYWTKDQQKELADLHPTMQPKVVEASKHIKKTYGVTTKDIAKGLGDPSFGVVTPATKAPLGKSVKPPPPPPTVHTPALKTKASIGGTTMQVLVSGGTWDKVTEAGNYIEDSPGYEAKLTQKEKNAISTWKNSPGTVRSAQLHMAGIKSDSPHAGEKYKSTLQNYEMADLPAAAGNFKSIRDEAVNEAKAFESAVAKAPKFDGVTYRGVKHLKPGTAYHEALTTPGTTVELLNHACTSRKNGEAFGFSLGNTILRMRSKSGGVIEDVSGFKSEHEVAIPRGTTFRVVRHVENVYLEGRGNVKTVIDLEEVEPHDTSIKVSLSLLDAMADLALSRDGSREDRFVETEPGVNWVVRLPLDAVIGPK